MITLNQLLKKPRKRKVFRTRTLFMGENPQKKGTCVRVYTTKPKKPNSAVRKIAKVYLPSTKRHILAYIPGQGHNLSHHSVVLIRGGRVRDIPGMHYKMIRGKCDFTTVETIVRRCKRSKYSLKRDVMFKNF